MGLRSFGLLRLTAWACAIALSLAAFFSFVYSQKRASKDTTGAAKPPFSIPEKKPIPVTISQISPNNLSNQLSNSTGTKPERKPVLVLRFSHIEQGVISAWTPQDDPGTPRYSSVNFLGGGTLFDHNKLFNSADTYPRTKDYTVAIPRHRKQLFETRIFDGRHYGHAYRIFIPNYTKKGIPAKPATRSGTEPRFDILFTGWNARARARSWGVRRYFKDKRVGNGHVMQVWRLHWVDPSEVRKNDIPYSQYIQRGY